MTANPFLDLDQLGELYGGASRPANRSSALRRAKTSGPFVPDTIVRLARTHRAGAEFVLDIGCGRGTSTRALAEGLRPEYLVGVDAAAALLTDAGERAEAHFVQGDFHSYRELDTLVTAAGLDADAEYRESLYASGNLSALSGHLGVYRRGRAVVSGATPSM